jgi:hypothetical protein
MIEKLQAHYGFTRMPFGRDLAPGMLHRHAAHNQACARITWCIAERAIGVVTGEAGAGKTASARTALAGLDASRHTIIYLPNPMIGTRGLHEMIVTTFGGTPDRSGSRLTAQASAVLAAERDERGRTPVLVVDLCRPRDYADAGSWSPAGPLLWRASAGWCYRHSSGAGRILFSVRAWCPPGGGAGCGARSRGRGCRVRWRCSRTGTGPSWIGWAICRIRGSSRSTRCRG